MLTIFLVFLPIKIFIKQDSRKGSRPDMEVAPILNGVNTLSYLFGRILPNKILNRSNLRQKIVPPLKIKVNNPHINIVIIMGESLTANAMSLFDGFANTTPRLDKLKSDSHFFYEKAFSSGSMTDISLPSFFNLLYQPDSTEQIVSTNTCLFKMAKNNGFTTYFYSAQSRDWLKYITCYLCPQWIDYYSDGEEVTKNIKKGTYDKFLLQKLDSIDMTKPSFIVLHQYGSHSPYDKRYPKEFEYFPPKDSLSKYKNSVYYTDFIVTSIIEKLKKKSKKPTYLFFTSDHGEGIDRYSGHGNLNDPNQHEVPFIYYVINDDLNKTEIEKYQGNGVFTSHFEIAKMVAEKLGYDVTSLRKFNGEYVVCGRDISGADGYLKIKVDNNGSMSRQIINP